MIGFDTLNFLINSPIDIKDSTILTLGNPFITDDIFSSNLIRADLKKKLKKIEKKKQIKYLFNKILGSKNIDILDISDEEGADYIFDLNKPISHFIGEKKYNIIFDFGTSEHIFNRFNFIENIFKLLDIGGIYLFHLPAGGQIDHGFIQYSPCFMYDFCFANRKNLSLLHLSLFHKNLKKGISTLPLYEKLDKDYKKVVDQDSINYEINTVNLKIFTGSSFRLFNYLSQVMLLGAIKKNKDSDINQSVIQCLYRNMSLEKILPSSTKKINNYKNMAKNIFLSIPFPALLKLKFLMIFSK